MVRGNQANRVNGYGRLTKLEFPRYNHDDVKGWIYRCNQHFERRNGLEVTWKRYANEVLKRFRAVVEDPMTDLKNLRQTNTIKVYQDQFDALLSKVDITKSQAISMFLGGMNTDIAMMVRMFKPRTLDDTYFLENLQEATNESRTKSKPVYTCYKNVASTSYGSYGGSGSVSTRNNRTLLALLAPKQTNNFAGGNQLVSRYACKSFEWKLQGDTFEADFMILPLGGCDMVLGIQFLSTLGDIKCNFYELRIEIKFNRCKGNHTNEKLQSEIKQLLEEFNDQVPKCLPSNIRLDHKILLKEGITLVNIRPYRYHPTQKDTIKTMVKELLDTRVIRQSNNLFSSPIVMVKKKDGSRRMCIDYTQLSQQIIKDKFPIPMIEELIDEMNGSRVFSKLDLRSGYHQIRMSGEDIYKTTFKTHNGHYEFLVITFGLTNAKMNNTLVFFDNI
nr:putative mitochondrial protein [Tanacetum cinerariifolium]